MVAADFFTTEVWTVRGFVTYYTLFVIELHSRRVRIVGSTPNPNEAFMRQMVRAVTDACDGVLGDRRILICDRDRKWSPDVRDLLETVLARLNSWTLRAWSLAFAHGYFRSSFGDFMDRITQTSTRRRRRADLELVPDVTQRCGARWRGKYQVTCNRRWNTLEHATRAVSDDLIIQPVRTITATNTASEECNAAHSIRHARWSS